MRGDSRSVLVVSSLVLHFSEAVAQATIDWGGPTVNLPTRENFLRRCFHRCAFQSLARCALFANASFLAIVVGNYLYIDGGEQSQIGQNASDVLVNCGIPVSAYTFRAAG